MFRSATLRLTAIYLGILLLICLSFSVVLYHVLSSELTRNFSLQSSFFENRPRFQPFVRDPEAVQFRDDQLSNGERHILFQILYVDIVLVGAGGFASYFLARRTLQPIEEAHIAQVRFTADASHELRTPLATMQTEVEVALRDPKLTLGQSKELLESNLEELSTLRHLTTSLLTLARGEEDVHQTYAKVSVQQVAAAAVLRVAKTAEKKKVKIILSIASGLKVQADSSQLTEVLVVLLENAIKYGPSGQMVTVQATSQADHVVVSVLDAGVGIKESDLSRIFERFYRADSARTNSKQSGHGLGLAIAKQIVEQHGGTITVESELGKGTTFQLTLPA